MTAQKPNARRSGRSVVRLVGAAIVVIGIATVVVVQTVVLPAVVQGISPAVPARGPGIAVSGGEAPMFVLTEGVEGTNWRPLSDEMLMDDASGCSVTSSRAANNEQIDGDDAASAWSADQLARRFGESESLDIATLAPTGLVLAGRRVTSVTLPEYESPSDVTIVTRSSSSAGATAAMTFVCPEDRSDTEQNAAVAGLLMVSATVATVDGDECSPCRWALMPADPTAG